MELHVLIPGRLAELVACVVDGQLVVVPPAPVQQAAVAERQALPAA